MSIDKEYRVREKSNLLIESTYLHVWPSLSSDSLFQATQQEPASCLTQRDCHVLLTKLIQLSVCTTAVECMLGHSPAFDRAATFACLGPSTKVHGVRQKVQCSITYHLHRLEALEEPFWSYDFHVLSWTLDM